MALTRYIFRRKILVILVVILLYNVVFMILTRKHTSILEQPASIMHPLEKQRETFPLGSLEKIDWNDYNLMERESKRHGLAEHGVAGQLTLNEEEMAKKDALLNKYQYDAYLGDRVSLVRSIGDIRPDACKQMKYLKDLPENSVSIVLPMFNEKNSTLLRSIHSIINRTPANLLREIIVVDDTSQEDELKAPLDDYVRTNFKNVKIIRNTQRQGLIRSRIIGADASTGSFLVFLDSHVEVNYNYLPPLLELMMLDYRTIACPTVDFISGTFNITTLAEKRARGGFNWRLGYRRMPVKVQMDETTPHASPVMVGCAFAISRKWWEEIGKYDPGFEVWGAEQYELSVKSWLCGGSVVDSTCSRVAHLFRNAPYLNDIMPVFNQNLVRFAMVWMDAYKEVVLMSMPHMRNYSPPIDIIKQIEFRRSLKCKPFDWFLTEVAPDILEHFPLIEPSPLAWGQIRSNLNTSLCVYPTERDIYLDNCNKEPKATFNFDWRHHIVEKPKRCFAFIEPEYLIIAQYIDIEVKPMQTFAWDHISGQIVKFYSNLCVDIKPDSLQLFMSECIENKRSQSWTFENFNLTQVVEVWEKHRKIRQ